MKTNKTIRLRLKSESVCRDDNRSLIDLLRIDIEGVEEKLFAEPKFVGKVVLLLIELHGDFDLDHFRGNVSKFQWTIRPPDPKLALGRSIAWLPEKGGISSVWHN